MAYRYSTTLDIQLANILNWLKYSTIFKRLVLAVTFNLIQLIQRICIFTKPLDSLHQVYTAHIFKLLQIVQRIYAGIVCMLRTAEIVSSMAN